MAVVSELSMYQVHGSSCATACYTNLTGHCLVQATAIKLAAETRSAQSALDAAAAASAAGHPPSAAAERRWQALRQSLEAAASGTGQAMDASPSFTEPDAKTTAEQVRHCCLLNRVVSSNRVCSGPMHIYQPGLEYPNRTVNLLLCDPQSLVSLLAWNVLAST
jgi:hypothetical protein